MAEELQSLLEKINTEGVRKAEAERDRILAAAREEAEKIVSAAKQEAADTAAKAAREADSLQQRAVAAAKQAARDITLQLRSELQQRLAAAVGPCAAQSFTPALMAELVRDLARSFAASPETELSVRCAVKDQQALSDALKSALADSFVKAPKIFAAKELTGGLEISFDGGKCFFDFTTEAVAELLNSYVGGELAGLFSAENK